MPADVACGRRGRGEGAGLVRWDGARESGGVAAPGVYFARFEDARGVAAARIVWLGR